MRTPASFIKLFLSLIALVLLGLACGPAVVNYGEYGAVQRWQSGLSHEASAEQSGTSSVEASKSQNADDKPLDSPMRTFPFLVSAAPYYCDPMRYPPNVVLAVTSCQPYLKNIGLAGFPPRRPPGFGARGVLATNHP